jgi:hypothetical protein
MVPCWFRVALTADCRRVCAALPAVKEHLPGDVVTVLVVRGTDEREESLAVEVATVHRAYPLRSAL